MSAKKHTGRAVYTGRRLMIGGKVYQRFEILPDRTEAYYSRIKGVCIGRTYACSKDSMARRPEWLDDPCERNPEWDAADALVEAHKAKKRADAKIRAESKSPAIKAAILALKPLVGRLGHFERKALIEFLAHETSKLDRKGKRK